MRTSYIRDGGLVLCAEDVILTLGNGVVVAEIVLSISFIPCTQRVSHRELSEGLSRWRYGPSPAKILLKSATRYGVCQLLLKK